jgi:hypothetical protein
MLEHCLGRRIHGDNLPPKIGRSVAVVLRHHLATTGLGIPLSRDHSSRRFWFVFLSKLQW